MRHVVGLYDAPVPAGAGLADLRAAGFDTGDIWVAPEVAAARLGPCAPYQVLSHGTHALARTLIERGVPPIAAADYAEAVERGAILVVVRTPALSAPIAAEALQGPGATDLEQHHARLRSDPNLSYGWAAAEPPVLPSPE